MKNKLTLTNSDEYTSDLRWRELNLKLAKHCLERYRDTNEQFYLDNSKVFMEWSDKIKENYL